MHSTSAYLSHIRFTLFFVHTKLLLFLVKYSSFFFSGMLYKVLKSLVFCSVAERIAYERGQTVGEDIGYKVTLLLSCLALVALLFYEQPLNSIVKKNNELLRCLISMTAIRQEVSFASPYSVVCGICTNWFCNCNKRKKNCSILQPTAKGKRGIIFSYAI